MQCEIQPLGFNRKKQKLYGPCNNQIRSGICRERRYLFRRSTLTGLPPIPDLFRKAEFIEIFLAER